MPELGPELELEPEPEQAPRPKPRGTWAWGRGTGRPTPKAVTDLPDELLRQVFLRLPGGEYTLAGTALVCRAWRRVAVGEGLWERLMRLQRRPPAPLLTHRAAFAASVRVDRNWRRSKMAKQVFEVHGEYAAAVALATPTAAGRPAPAAVGSGDGSLYIFRLGGTDMQGEQARREGGS